MMLTMWHLRAGGGESDWQEEGARGRVRLS